MKTFEKIILVVLFFLFISIFVLVYLYFQLDKKVSNISSDNTTLTEVDNSQPVDLAIAKKQLEILEATASSLLKRVEDLEETQPITSTTSKNVVLSPSTNFQKQIIHIGSTSTNETSWVNSGIEVVLNTEDYPDNVDATFEAGISVVSGEGWARLVNKSTGAVMSISEVYNNTNETVWVSSPKFKLHEGPNTYEVQVRSTSSEIANFSSARIILTTPN